eukprot:gene693-8945_t
MFSLGNSPAYSQKKTFDYFFFWDKNTDECHSLTQINNDVSHEKEKPEEERNINNVRMCFHKDEKEIYHGVCN